MKTSPTHWPQVYLCVALTTLATLLLELSLTRIFSVVFYYHMAFLAISIALFGLGIGGVFSYVVAGWKAPLYLRLGRLSAANSLLLLLALTVILLQKTYSSELGAGADLFHRSAAVLSSPARLFRWSISETIERVDRVYFFDLLGAAGGCLLLIPLLESVRRTEHGDLRRPSSSPWPRRSGSAWRDR